jgi:hypothetical protein
VLEWISSIGNLAPGLLLGWLTTALVCRNQENMFSLNALKTKPLVKMSVVRWMVAGLFLGGLVVPAYADGLTFTIQEGAPSATGLLGGVDTLGSVALIDVGGPSSSFSDLLIFTPVLNANGAQVDTQWAFCSDIADGSDVGDAGPGQAACSNFTGTPTLLLPEGPFIALFPTLPTTLGELTLYPAFPGMPGGPLVGEPGLNAFLLVSDIKAAVPEPGTFALLFPAFVAISISIRRRISTN